MLSAAIRALSALVRRRRPLGPSITSSRETPTPLEPSKWTPILPSLSKSNPSAAHVRGECWLQVKNGRRGSASRLRHNSRCIANILNEEGFVPPKRRNTYTAEMVRHRLVVAGIAKPQRKKSSASATVVREPDEWTIQELAKAIGMPQATLYHWVANGRLSSRLVQQDRKPVKLVTADAAMIAHLKAIRASPPHLKRLPPRQSAEQLNLIT